MHISDSLNYNFLFDSHCHLNEDGYDDTRDQIIDTAISNGVELILDTSVNIKSAKKSLEIAKNRPNRIKSWVGMDPEIFVPGSELFEEGNLNISSKALSLLKKQLQDLIDENKKFIVGIGECGMDYYWLGHKIANKELNEGKSEKSKDLQFGLFKMQLELASEKGLPLSIHSRGAEEECLDLIGIFPDQSITGIFHSYAGSYSIAKKILDLGFGLGVNGIITFPKAEDLRAVYSRLLGKVSRDWSPQDFYKKGIFFETDSPFLAPQSKRGQRNEPGNIKEIYESFVEMLT
jgi:TatD DNase family protein